MSLEYHISRRRNKRRASPGKISSLLTASVVTLIGLAVGLEPYVILWRALVSALLMGALVSFGMSVISVANTSKKSS